MEKMTVLARLAVMFPEAKKTTLREMVAGKRVRVNGEVVKSAKAVVDAGDKVEVGDAASDPTQATLLQEGLRLVHLDSQIAVIEKPAGLLTSTDAQEKRPTAWRILTDYLRGKNHKNQIHLVHRLDRDASGLLVFARTRDAYVHLKQQFFEHTITRRYDVIVHGVPKKAKGRLENLLLEVEFTGEVRVTPDVRKGKVAILDYEVVASSKDKKLSHLRCTLYTGRKHQIRVQLKAAGHHVSHDPVYGVGEQTPGRLALHASHLTFVHPGTKREVSFDCPMPRSFGHLLNG